MDWRSGLNNKINQAKGFYAVLTLSFFIGLAIALSKINPIKMLFYSQVINGLITPFVLAVILKLATKDIIMKKYVISKTQKNLGWITVVVMIFAGVAAFTL
jgi:Mn2+/Fe2+ NRAMP family transporter